MIDTMISAREQIGRLDIAIAAFATALALVDISLQIGNDETTAGAVAIPFYVGITVPLLWRRRAPLIALAAMLAALLVHIGLFGAFVRCGIVFPAAFLLVFAAAARLDRGEAFAALAIALGICLAVCLSDAKSGAPPSAMLFIGPVTVAVWLVGRVLHSRGRMVGELEARTAELREARDERARLEVSTDRARLSAELDELLQRRLGELAELSDRGVGNGDAEAVTATLAEIEHKSRRTLQEMRAVVGALRDEDSDAPMGPPPTLTHMEALLLRAKGAGARMTVEGSPRVLPAGVELSAYRVVEYLLDALDDAEDVEVRVHFTDDALELKVAGSARRRGEEAIERARERVRLHQGTLRATTHDGRAEAVVSLPIFAAV